MYCTDIQAYFNCMLQQSNPTEVKQKRKTWKLSSKKSSVVQNAILSFYGSVCIFNTHMPRCELTSLVGFLGDFLFKV